MRKNQSAHSDIERTKSCRGDAAHDKARPVLRHMFIGEAVRSGAMPQRIKRDSARGLNAALDSFRRESTPAEL